MTTDRRLSPVAPPEEAAWGAPAQREALWPARLAVLATVLLYVTLPEGLTLGAAPKWSVAIGEVALLIPLTIAAPRMAFGLRRWVRPVAIASIAVVNLANVLSLVLLVDALLHGRSNLGHVHLDGPTLILAAIETWLTNVLVFGLWYWELDRGGPSPRSRPDHREPDFLFPQMITPRCTPGPWAPGFLDYLYVSFTNATAFSPTDTPPLTPWAKALMAAQSLISLLTIALVAARAVNILK